jgi:hypothetical protein
MTYFASDFQDLDNSQNIDNFIQCLELQQSLDLYKYGSPGLGVKSV